MFYPMLPVTWTAVVSARTTQWTLSVSVTQTSQLILYREIIAVCSEIHTKHMNTVRGQNVEILGLGFNAFKAIRRLYDGQYVGKVQLKCDGTREGKWRGNWRMEWVASILHTTTELGISSITTADEHTLAASSRLNWRPHPFKWTRPFRSKTKCGFCACAITFQTQSTGDVPTAHLYTRAIYAGLSELHSHPCQVGSCPLLACLSRHQTTLSHLVCSFNVSLWHIPPTTSVSPSSFWTIRHATCSYKLWSSQL